MGLWFCDLRDSYVIVKSPAALVQPPPLWDDWFFVTILLFDFVYFIKRNTIL